MTEDDCDALSAIALVGTALMIGVASAQMTTKERSDAMTNVHKEGQWRSSKLIGIDVYNDANEKIGEIEELIIDKSGNVANVILGVGGFLGMGEHYVAISMDKLKWVNEPARTTSTAPVNTPTVSTTDKGAVTGVVNRSNRPMRAANEMWHPDHAVLNATKDQLKAMPQLKYD
jgi:hypothetical protein